MTEGSNNLANFRLARLDALLENLMKVSSICNWINKVDIVLWYNFYCYLTKWTMVDYKGGSRGLEIIHIRWRMIEDDELHNNSEFSTQTCRISLVMSWHILPFTMNNLK